MINIITYLTIGIPINIDPNIYKVLAVIIAFLILLIYASRRIK